MKEGQIYRINFLKREGHGFTFRGMIYGLSAWVAFLALLFGVQYLRVYRLDKELVLVKERLASLDAEKDRQIELVRAVGKKRSGVASRQDLASILVNRPRWEGMLRALTRALPPDVWLDSVSVDPAGDWYSVKIAGKAKTQRAITTYMLQMEGSGYFSRTALDKTELSDAQAGAFDFNLTTEPVAQRLLRDD